MNITTLFALYLANANSQYVAEDINIEISQSLRYVIDNYFLEYSNSFVCILSCSRRHTTNFFSDLMQVLFSTWNNMKIQIVINDLDAGPIGPGERNFNLIFVDSAEAFMTINPASQVQNYDTNEFYYVFVQNYDRYLKADIQRVLDYFWQHYIINVSILVQLATGELKIYTYFPFTRTHCGKVVPVLINQYRNGSMANEEIFPKKLRDMHQCPLKVAVWNISPFLSVDVDDSGHFAIGGFEGELLKALSDLMNFRIDITIPPNNEDRGTIQGNKTTGAIRMLEHREADLGLGFFRFTIAAARRLTATDTYYQSKQSIMVLKESPNYLSPELAFYPFSAIIWAIIILIFVLLLVILGATSFWARKMSITMSNVSINNICMSFVAITLGLSSALNPKSCFGRCFIATWLLTTLVIRTQYQALIFHLVRNNFFKLPPSTIDDLVQHGYLFVMNQYAFQNMKAIGLFTASNVEIVHIDGLSDEPLFAFLEENADMKYAVVAPKEFLLHYAAKNQKAGVFAILNENVIVHSTCIYLTKHSFLVDRINDLVRWMSAFGWIASWANKALHQEYFRVHLEAKKVTIGQKELRGVFRMCAILLALSSFVFILEVFSVKYETITRQFQKYKGKLLTYLKK